MQWQIGNRVIVLKARDCEIAPRGTAQLVRTIAAGITREECLSENWGNNWSTESWWALLSCKALLGVLLSGGTRVQRCIKFHLFTPNKTGRRSPRFGALLRLKRRARARARVCATHLRPSSTLALRLGFP